MCGLNVMLSELLQQITHDGDLKIVFEDTIGIPVDAGSFSDFFGLPLLNILNQQSTVLFL